MCLPGNPCHTIVRKYLSFKFQVPHSSDGDGRGLSVMIMMSTIMMMLLLIMMMMMLMILLSGLRPVAAEPGQVVGGIAFQVIC